MDCEPLGPQYLEAMLGLTFQDAWRACFFDDAGMGPGIGVPTPIEAVESQQEAILYRGHGSGHPFVRPGQIRRQSGVDRLCVIDDPFDDRMARIIQHRDRPEGCPNVGTLVGWLLLPCCTAFLIGFVCDHFQMIWITAKTIIA